MPQSMSRKRRAADETDGGGMSQPSSSGGAVSEVEKRRLASRISSQRTREREKQRLEHFRGRKVQLDYESNMLKAENKQLRDLIRQAKENRKQGGKRPPLHVPATSSIFTNILSNSQSQIPGQQTAASHQGGETASCNPGAAPPLMTLPQHHQMLPTTRGILPPHAFQQSIAGNEKGLNATMLRLLLASHLQHAGGSSSSPPAVAAPLALSRGRGRDGGSAASASTPATISSLLQAHQQQVAQQQLLSLLVAPRSQAGEATNLLSSLLRGNNTSAPGGAAEVNPTSLLFPNAAAANGGGVLGGNHLHASLAAELALQQQQQQHAAAELIARHSILSRASILAASANNRLLPIDPTGGTCSGGFLPRLLGVPPLQQQPLSVASLLPPNNIIDALRRGDGGGRAALPPPSSSPPFSPGQTISAAGLRSAFSGSLHSPLLQHPLNTIASIPNLQGALLSSSTGQHGNNSNEEQHGGGREEEKDQNAPGKRGGTQ